MKPENAPVPPMSYTTSWSVQRESEMMYFGRIVNDKDYEVITGKFIKTLSGGFLVTNWLEREQHVLRDVSFSFSDSIQNPCIKLWQPLLIFRPFSGAKWK